PRNSEPCGPSSPTPGWPSPRQATPTTRRSPSGRPTTPPRARPWSSITKPALKTTPAPKSESSGSKCRHPVRWDDRQHLPRRHGGKEDTESRKSKFDYVVIPERQVLARGICFFNSRYERSRFLAPLGMTRVLSLFIRVIRGMVFLGFAFR